AVRNLATDAPRIILMHHPESFAELPAGTAPLAFAGHTHGGQVRVPFKPDWSGAIITGSEVRRDGWIDGYGEPGNRLYVNRGIGMSLAPIRLFCRPAVTFFTLRSDA
ncbi:MAG TPA: metallophosphoesterase, partial [Chloroflexota bacterium]|nr:metallophosphoesterase [Chloroflexota bacterium]